MQQLKEQLWEFIRAGFSGLWIQTHEGSEAILEIGELARQQRLQLWTWNLDCGLQVVTGDSIAQSIHDPLAVIRQISTVSNTDVSTLLVLENFHRFIDSAEVCQALLTQIQLGKQLGRHLIIVSPIVKLPPELERHFVVLEHPLPERAQLWEVASTLSEETKSCTSDRRERLLDAAAGLTCSEAESAFSLSLVRHGSLVESEVWGLKSRWLKKSGLLQLYLGEQGFDSLGGLQTLKEFCSHSLRPGNTDRRAKPRGVMLLGVPGTGKSAFAKSLGKETNRPVLMLDVGQLMGSLVGQSESNIRSALKTADAMAPCILFIDEVEKALAGVASGSSGDSGVSSRLFGSLLTWLNDHTSDVYVVVTCNNIQHLPPEFSRAERFDAIMFLDLPGQEEKNTIWQLYLEQFSIDQTQPRPKDQYWTGAEIKACCRLASLLGTTLVEAGSYIVPVGVTSAENIERLRTWASGRCLNAASPGIYQYQPDRQSNPTGPTPRSGNRSRRGISVKPSDN